MGISVQNCDFAILVHSIDYVVKCRVYDLSGNRLQFFPLEKRVDMFQVNDPLVLMYKEDGILQLNSGDIMGVDMVNNTAEMAITDIDVMQEKRVFERYPVSMAVSARRKFSNKRYAMVAKNISQYGMLAISKTDFEVEESIDMDLITGKYMFYFVGKVVWKKQKGNIFEYGFQLTDFDISTKNSMEAYLSKLTEEYGKMYAKAK